MCGRTWEESKGGERAEDVNKISSYDILRKAFLKKEAKVYLLDLVFWL